MKIHPQSEHVHHTYIVPMLGPAEWEFTVDSGPVNHQTYMQAFPVPVREIESDKKSGASHFAELDMTPGIGNFYYTNKSISVNRF